MKNIKDLIKDFDHEKIPCKQCKLGYEKYKLLSYYLICNKEYSTEAFLDFLNFNDNFVMKYAAMREDCERSDERNKDYCQKWIKDFKKYIKYDE